MDKFRAILVALALVLAANGGTGAESLVDTLAGPLPATIPNAGGPYLVVSDVSVTPGEVVTIEPGVALLFADFTALQVHGTLLARGAEDAPIVFTSDNDRRYLSEVESDAAPYDWNGITVMAGSGGSVFEHCEIGYSLYGVNSLTPQVRIVDCSFHANGKADFGIDGTQRKVGEEPFTYDVARPGFEEPSKRRPALAISSGVVLAAGLAVGVWRTVEFSGSSKRFSELNEVTEADLMSYNSAQEWDEAREQRTVDLATLIAGYGLALLGGVGLVISF